MLAVKRKNAKRRRQNSRLEAAGSNPPHEVRSYNEPLNSVNEGSEKGKTEELSGSLQTRTEINLQRR